MRLFIGGPDKQIEYERKYSRLPQPVVEMQERDFLRYTYRTNVQDIKKLAQEMHQLGWVKEDYSDRVDKHIDLSLLATATGEREADLSKW